MYILYVYYIVLYQIYVVYDTFYILYNQIYGLHYIIDIHTYDYMKFISFSQPGVDRTFFDMMVQ